MPTATQVINDTIATVTDAETVIDSATLFVNSVPTMIQTAVEAAIGLGATQEQLQPFMQLNVDLAAKKAALAAAIVANTPPPAPPVPPAPPAPPTS